jgi:hypothetical protein
VELQKRIGIWDLDYYVGRRALQWLGHVARMDMSRLPASRGRSSGRK